MTKTLMLQSRIEALLFVVGDDGLTIKQLSQLLGEQEELILQTMNTLRETYEEDLTRGITVKEIAGVYQLITKSEFADTIQRLVENPTAQSLSQASLEVLAIVAYKQPITRVAIEDLRGVKCERPIQTLVSRGLIKEVGRSEGTGRAILYGTTKEFLHYFGLNSIEEMPPLPEEDLADTEQETDLFMTKFQETFSGAK
ncbi:MULTISPECIES: SMC-Scp complex subunit ScpB [Lysinibacillus]|jgi:segregation and condensation protein B|uniref:Segregation and condensation protein B n=1 Tax=Lysinibacillus capsici TaxID=2115968 RepID=A0A2X0XR70_9BACI|nr:MULTISPECIES: SMC-Scp complex subunit ScpB [Lysinibacillus]KMN40828.1 segregation and condensation protein B [Lysinibacillus sp. LK3]MCR6523863.1 SMC-Scp complex subunit ScpB [Lysinibacillus capsici]MCT1540791.1 SMC-Scp complex subunit ScpB [Lysinibacillus capsici]MCT1572139.1 SMC-Scp complex subunit ScpB [Lysinibacillus capsici]MCT1649304.1 SMC-Scp complex subunit ScpB [Lysinibacillus capsici]